MAKCGYRQMDASLRHRIAQVARTMFEQGYDVSAVLERFKIELTTLKGICREHDVRVPSSRRG